MSAEQNKAMVRHVISLLNRDDWEQAVRDGAPEPGREEFIEMQRPFRAAFPDFRSTIEEMVAEGDTVVVRLKAGGTHMAEFPYVELKGIPATGKRVQWDEVQIYRFEDGKPVSAWLLLDGVSRLQQLGVLPEPEYQPGTRPS